MLSKTWAHPRSRGENIECRPECSDGDGSSPLTRGKQRSGLSTPCAHGLIPAHAGKTGLMVGRTQRMGAHPRSRGENKDALAAVKGTAGSSPLTRGKPLERFTTWARDGLIPAHAGKTGASLMIRIALRAHPRSRGENLPFPSPSHARAGSSPLTRGKQNTCLGVGPAHGLIPAHAGKTRTISWCAGAPWAHPRSRGENPTVPVRAGPVAGSSPLTRGKPVIRADLFADARLIPAHAGKTR